MEFPQHALGDQVDHRNDDDPENGRVEIDEIDPDQLPQDDVESGSDQRTDDRSGPAQHDHHRHLDRKQHVEDVLRLDEGHHRGVNGSRGRNDQSGNRERGNLEAEHIDADHLRGILVLPDATQAEAELRARNQRSGGKGDHHQQPHREVEEEARRARRPRENGNVHADGAAGQLVPVVRDLAHHLDHCDRADGEVMAAQAEQDASEQGGEDHAAGCRGDPGERHGPVVVLHDAADIGAEPEEGRSAERGIAHEAADHVPGQAKHGRHCQCGSGLEQIVVGEKAKGDHCGDDRSRNQPALQQGLGAAAHSKPFLPASPEGRSTRTRIIKANPTVTLHCEPNATAPKLSSRPSARPPTRAPGTLPRPPRTQITNDLPRKTPLRSGVIG